MYSESIFIKVLHNSCNTAFMACLLGPLWVHISDRLVVLVLQLLHMPSAIQPPINVRATVLTPQSFEITWTLSPSTDTTGYLISYSTTALYTSGGSVMVRGNSATSSTLNNLEEGTTYTITVQAIDSDIIMSGNSNAVTVTTYTAGK